MQENKDQLTSKTIALSPFEVFSIKRRCFPTLSGSNGFLIFFRIYDKPCDFQILSSIYANFLATRLHEQQSSRPFQR